MKDDRIAEVVDVSKPGATLQVHEVRLTAKGRESLTIRKTDANKPGVPYYIAVAALLGINLYWLVNWLSSLIPANP